MGEKQQEVIKKVDQVLEDLNIKARKIEGTPYIWFISLATEKEGPVIETKLELIGNDAFFLQITSNMGDLPPNPKDQWAMFLRILQLNYAETEHGYFAIDSQNNEIIFKIINGSEIIIGQMGYFLNLIIHVYMNVRPKFLGFVN
jgi:hypothetical protein